MSINPPNCVPLNSVCETHVAVARTRRPVLVSTATIDQVARAGRGVAASIVITIIARQVIPNLIRKAGLLTTEDTEDTEDCRSGCHCRNEPGCFRNDLGMPRATKLPEAVPKTSRLVAEVSSVSS